MFSMNDGENKKEHIELQYQEMLLKAKALYPSIDEAVETLNNITAQTISLQDYLNLTMQTPTSTSSNQIAISQCQHGDNY
jgi:hypothetical protein